MHKHAHRIHIPVTSNGHSFNTWLTATCKMHPGKVYEINNRILHGAFNKGSTFRTHLIIDFIDPVLYENLIASGNKIWQPDYDDLTPTI